MTQMDLETFGKLIHLMLQVHKWSGMGLLEVVPEWVRPALSGTLDLADELHQWTMEHGLDNLIG